MIALALLAWLGGFVVLVSAAWREIGRRARPELERERAEIRAARTVAAVPPAPPAPAPSPRRIPYPAGRVRRTPGGYLLAVSDDDI